MAQRIRQRRRRGVDGERGARPGPVKTEAARCHASAGSSRRQPNQLDDPAPHHRDRGARGRQDWQITTVQGAAGFRWRPKHAERPPERGRDRARGPCAFCCEWPRPRPATSFSPWRRERGPDTSLSGPSPIWPAHRPSAVPSGPPSLHRRQRSRSRNPRSRTGLEQRATPRSVGQSENLCHENRP